MKKLFIKLLILFLLLVVLDRIGGTILEKMFYKQQHGDDFVSIQLLDSTQAKVLIFGSSRASHHYVSDSLEKYSHLTVYNGGRDNMGIHHSYATLQALVKRYKPTSIIFDIIPYAFLKGNQNVKKYYDAQTSVLLPFANQHPTMYETISDIDKLETWKAKAIKMYAYNSLIGSMVQNTYTHFGHTQQKGYEPLQGKIDAPHYTKPIFQFPTQDTEIDSVAFTYLKKCLAICKQNNIKAQIVFSPFYFEMPIYKTLQAHFVQLASENNCSIIDYSHDTFFTKNASLFYDELHLNDSGAIIFSKKISQQLSIQN